MPTERPSPSDPTRMWFVSNGHGEDRTGALIARHVRSLAPETDVVAVPLVGDGDAYRIQDIRLLGAGAAPPSGGFSTLARASIVRDIPMVVRDLPSLATYFRIGRTARQTRRPGDRVVVVGDVFALLFARTSLGSADTFVALPHSVAHLPHSRLERRAIRLYAANVFTRDEPTAVQLRESRIDARWVGNPLMDDLESRTPLPAGGPLVALLPGSRDEAAGNLEVLLDVAEGLAPGLRLAAALPTWFDEARVRAAVAARGWAVESDALVKHAHRVELYRGRFADVVHASVVAVGMAGTANEQAVGLGCPVVSCCGTGPQSTRARLRGQEQLLGGAARFVDGPAALVAEEINRLLQDVPERERRGELGRRCMGAPGASARIAAAIVGHASTMSI